MADGRELRVQHTATLKQLLAPKANTKSLLTLHSYPQRANVNREKLLLFYLTFSSSLGREELMSIQLLVHVFFGGYTGVAIHRYNSVIAVVEIAVVQQKLLFKMKVHNVSLRNG